MKKRIKNYKKELFDINLIIVYYSESYYELIVICSELKYVFQEPEVKKGRNCHWIR